MEIYFLVEEVSLGLLDFLLGRMEAEVLLGSIFGALENF